ASSPFLLTRVKLENMLMSAGVFRCFVSAMIRSGYCVDCAIEGCEVEQEEKLTQLHPEMKDQTTLKVVKQTASTDYKIVTIRYVTMSAGTFRLLSCTVMQLGNSGRFELYHCKIEHEEDAEIDNQPALHVVTPQDAELDYKTVIKLEVVSMSTGTFRCLVRTVIQSGHSGECNLFDCTIEPEKDVRPVQEEMKSQDALQAMTPQNADLDYETVISLEDVTMSAGTFMCLVNTVIQSGHSGECNLLACIIQPEEDLRPVHAEIENQHDLQVGDAQNAGPDYVSVVKLTGVTMPAEVFTHLVSMLLQSGHSGDYELFECTTGPEEDYGQLQTEMVNQAAFRLTQQPVSLDYTTEINFSNMTLPARWFRYIVNMVVRSGHDVSCEFVICDIEPEENQPAYQLVSTSTDYTTSIAFQNMSISAGAFRRLVSMITQSGHSMEYEFNECTIEEEEDMSQLMDEMGNQPILDQLPTAPDYAKRIKILFTTISASVVNYLINMVQTSKHDVKCMLLDCIIEPEEDVRQLLMEMEDNSAIEVYRWVEDRRPVSSNKEREVTVKSL
ncbi:hypothetical protein MAR_007194, partial [Mya arenaria]